MSGITVSFGTITQAQSDVTNTVSRVESQLGDLRQYLAPLVASWEGGASTDYQTLQRRWDSAAGDLNSVLQQIGQLLGRVHDGYRSTESANSACWS